MIVIPKRKKVEIYIDISIHVKYLYLEMYLPVVLECSYFLGSPTIVNTSFIKCPFCNSVHIQISVFKQHRGSWQQNQTEH